jgi:hypothetical protein
LTFTDLVHLLLIFIKKSKVAAHRDLGEMSAVLVFLPQKQGQAATDIVHSQTRHFRLLLRHGYIAAFLHNFIGLKLAIVSDGSSLAGLSSYLQMHIFGLFGEASEARHRAAGGRL